MSAWKVKKDIVQCSLCKAPTVWVELAPRQKVELLMKEYQHQEWLGYLVGEADKDQIYVEDLIIPPHKEVSISSAEAEPFHTPENCIGVIHSHHSIGAFHSGTDQAHVDRNYPVSITVARKDGNLEYDCVSYQATPCGKGTVLKATIKYIQPAPLFDTDSFLEQAKKNIEKGRGVVLPAQIGMIGGKKYIFQKNGHVLTQQVYEELLEEVSSPDYEEE